MIFKDALLIRHFRHSLEVTEPIPRGNMSFTVFQVKIATRIDIAMKMFCMIADELCVIFFFNFMAVHCNTVA